MAPKLSRLYSHHVSSQTHTIRARKDALLIGPGGEIVAAYGAGNGIPAIPQVVTGRLQQYTAADSPQATAAADQPNVSPTQAPTAVLSMVPLPSASTAIDPVSVASLSGSSADSTQLATPSPSSSPVFSSTSTSGVTSSTSISATTASSTSSIASAPSSVTASSSASPSSSVTPSAVVAPTQSGSPDHRQLYLGIALASIFVAALLVALAVYLYRICAASRRQRRRAGTIWPWDRKKHDNEGGLPGESTYNYGRFGASSNEPKDRVDGELPDPRYTGRSYAERQLAHGLYDIPITASPFRPVPLPHMTTIPDLEPELGLLQVANYVPGDISSDDGSRANSRQGVITDGAPLASASPAAEQWSVYGPEDGFRNPWSPLRVKSREGLGIVTEGGVANPPAEDEHAKVEKQTEASAPQDGWAASLRSNIAHALQVVVSSASKASLVSLPRAPEKHDHPTEVTENPFEDPTSSTTSLPEVTTDIPTPRCTECLSPGDEAVLDPSDRPPCLCEWLKQKNLPVPPSMQQHTHLTVPSPAPGSSPHGAAPSPMSHYDSPSGSSKGSQSPDFELPQIPTSRRGSQSSLQQAIDHKRLQRGRSKKLLMTPRTLRYGSTPLVRAGSTCTVGSDMSRCGSTDSASSGPLTDQEQFAVRMLKERRKRVMDSQGVAAKHSLSRPSVRLGSRRRPKAGPRTPAVDASVP